MRGEHDPTGVVVRSRGELHAEAVLRQELLDGVPPPRPEHPVAATQLVEPEIDDVLYALEPVHVDVSDVEAARVLLHQRERW